jgi:hypothetical protein
MLKPRSIGRNIVQAVRRRLFTEEPQVQSPLTFWDPWWTKWRWRSLFSKLLRFSLATHHSTIEPYACITVPPRCTRAVTRQHIITFSNFVASSPRWITLYWATVACAVKCLQHLPNTTLRGLNSDWHQYVRRCWDWFPQFKLTSSKAKLSPVSKHHIAKGCRNDFTFRPL